ncbi:MAG TPA: hypothetical protein VM487_09400 [Phycisphaerae bacterium]|nr:hypothetical protein [Phycisphaerae bacterium]
MAQQKKKPTIVSVYLTPQGKAKLDKVCADRGMTIKAVLCRLLDCFVALDRTEQAIVLGQVEARHVRTLADLIGRRGPRKTTATAGRGAR